MLIRLNIMHTIFSCIRRPSNGVNWFAMKLFTFRSSIGRLYFHCKFSFAIFMCIRAMLNLFPIVFSLFFRLFSFALAVLVVCFAICEFIDERTKRKLQQRARTSKEPSNRKVRGVKRSRYCEFCSITTIDKLQFMWKLSLCQAFV